MAVGFLSFWVLGHFLFPTSLCGVFAFSLRPPADQRTRPPARHHRPPRTLAGSGGSGAEMSSLLVSRAVKPWQGRGLEGSGGSGARFWTRGLCVEWSSLLASRVAKPWQGRVL